MHFSMFAKINVSAMSDSSTKLKQYPRPWYTKYLKKNRWTTDQSIIFTIFNKLNL